VKRDIARCRTILRERDFQAIEQGVPAVQAQPTEATEEAEEE